MQGQDIVIGLGIRCKVRILCRIGIGLCKIRIARLGSCARELGARLGYCAGL